MEYLFHHILRASARRSPDKEALVHGETRLSYSQVVDKVAGIAKGLLSLGLQRGARVGIYLDPSVAQVLSIFGVSQAGGVFVPINHLLMSEQVSHIARDCGMTGIITSNGKCAALAPVLGQIPSMQFLVVEGENVPKSSLRTARFDDWVVGEVPERLVDVNIEKDLAGILYTSGSTGKPKGVMLTHAQIMAGASIVSEYLEITYRDRILAVLPFSFDAGLNQLTTSFQQGGTLILINFVFAREIVQMLAKESVTGLAGVPTLWNLLSQHNSSLDKTPLPNLRYITNTGGAMPQPVLGVLRKVLPSTRIILMYGLTEAFRSTYLPFEELDRRPTSMGKAIPNTEILVVNEQGSLCGPGEVGELVHRGPTVSMGYWGQPELTAKVLRPHPCLPPELGGEEKVCYSGDLVKMDEEGFLYFIGRRDTMIKSSGFRISPTEVEEVLYSSGALRGAAVIGIPDQVLGQAIKAYVVLKEGTQATAESLLTHCGERLPRFMVPRIVEFLDELPKTASGKVDYPALRRRESLA